MTPDFSDGNPVGREIRAGETPMQYTSGAINSRRLIRAVSNPMDKCTIVSIFPKAIDEYKPTVEPGKFHIDAGTYEKPATLVVGSSSWWQDYDVEKPAIEIPCSSIQVSESIVKDFCNAMFACDMADRMPGLFYVMGSYKVEAIKAEFQKAIDVANRKQRNWFSVLVKEADSLWARSNNNPLVIMDEMRIAAEALGFNDKPWIRDFIQIRDMQPCKYCGTMRDMRYPVCHQCKAIDQTHPLAKDIKFAAA